jgi:DNA-binding beta-propeller fold protein YncE
MIDYDNACHIWTFDGQQYVDLVAGRPTQIVGSGQWQAGHDSEDSFDANRTGVVVAGWAGYLTPPRVVDGTPCGGTGLAYIPSTDQIVVVNTTDSQVILIDRETGAEALRWPLSVGTGPFQGIAYDSASDELIVAPASGSQWHAWTRDGIYVRAVPGTAGNAICYDSLTDSLWGRATGGKLRRIHKVTGAMLAEFVIMGEAAGKTIEGIAHNPTSNLLYITVDSTDRIYEIDPATGATIYSFRGPFDIEHPCWVSADNCIYISGLGRSHSLSQGGENVIYRLKLDGHPRDWDAPLAEYTLEMWVKPDARSNSYPVMFSNRAAAKSGATYQQVHLRSNGVLRVYRTDNTYIDSASGVIALNVWQHVVVRYETTGVLTAWVSGVKVIDTTGPANFGPDGRISIGGPASGVSPTDVWYDDVALYHVAKPDIWIIERAAA